jgi:lipoate-protein ligase B
VPKAVDRVLKIIGPRMEDYEAALDLQHRLVEQCLESGRRDNFLLMIEHPPVITIGRSGAGEDVLADRKTLSERGVAVVATNRGGQVTFHGPGQLVVYPVIDLKARGSDLHHYLRGLEGWLVGLLQTYGIEAGVNPPHTGVWVGGAKIASIGIAVRRWVAYHGVALNVATDLSFFDTIVPCGLSGVEMTSMEALLGNAPPLEDVARRAAQLFCEQFGFGRTVDVPDQEIAQVR